VSSLPSTLPVFSRQGLSSDIRWAARPILDWKNGMPGTLATTFAGVDCPVEGIRLVTLQAPQGARSGAVASS
jgi:hypothetical protein